MVQITEEAAYSTDVAVPTLNTVELPEFLERWSPTQSAPIGIAIGPWTLARLPKNPQVIGHDLSPPTRYAVNALYARTPSCGTLSALTAFFA